MDELPSPLLEAVYNARIKAREVFEISTIYDPKNVIRWWIPVNLTTLINQGLGMNLHPGWGQFLGLPVFQAGAVTVDKQSPVMWIEDHLRTCRISILNDHQVIVEQL